MRERVATIQGYETRTCMIRRLVRGEKAGEGTRTLDIQLGKLALYQLSYARRPGSVAHRQPTREGNRSAGKSWLAQGQWG